MLFNSLEFLIFFPIVVIVFFAVPKRWKNLWLLAASYYFYMCWNARYALLLLFSTVVTYLSGLLMDRVQKSGLSVKRKRNRKKAVVAVSFFLNLFILFYFKYINFALETLKQLFALIHVELQVPFFDVLLPVGISFYIFQALGYTMDVYREKIFAERNFFQYALFVSFFPQLVAGPIERSGNLLKQLKEPKPFDYDSVRAGLLLMLWGLFLKVVISDRCAVLVNTVYGNYQSFQGYGLILANLLFGVQIYCDFMGYSVVAKGAACVMGYELMDNFSQPYLAASIRDFWRRWHISLSSWLRDYLYIPLGGSRGGRLKKYRNLLITFLVSGLWHGAKLTFLVWGGLHGVFQIAEDLAAPLWAKLRQLLRIHEGNVFCRILGILKTFVLVEIGWVFFRAESVSSALWILRNSFVLTDLTYFLQTDRLRLGLNGTNLLILFLAMCVLAVTEIMKEMKIQPLKWLSSRNFLIRYGVYWGAMLFLLCSMNIMGQEFIYFQF